MSKTKSKLKVKSVKCAVKSKAKTAVKLKTSLKKTNKRSVQRQSKTALQKISGFSDGKLEGVASKSTSLSQVLRTLGVYVNGRNVSAIRERLQDIV